jgi:hypothetical protein
MRTQSLELLETNSWGFSSASTIVQGIWVNSTITGSPPFTLSGKRTLKKKRVAVTLRCQTVLIPMTFVCLLLFFTAITIDLLFSALVSGKLFL